MLTAESAVTRADEIKPNGIGAACKYELLYELDRRIMAEVIGPRGNPDGVGASPELASGDPSAPLLADGHPGLYVCWLLAQIDLLNGDLARYANSREVFNEAFDSFRNEYNRTHSSRNVKLRY